MEQSKYDNHLILAILNGHVSEALNKKLRRNFIQYDVDLLPDEWVVMSQLWIKDGANQNELCKATQKDKTNMTRLIDQMVEHKLVVRIPDMHDRRQRHIFVTQKGKEMEGKATFVAKKTLKEVLRGLTNEEVRISQELLRIVYKNCME